MVFFEGHFKKPLTANIMNFSNSIISLTALNQFGCVPVLSQWTAHHHISDQTRGIPSVCAWGEVSE